MKIVVLDGFTLSPGDLSWDVFQPYGSLMVYDRTPPQEVISRIGDAEIVLTNKTKLDAKVMGECPNLRYIGVLATGYNVVDTASAKGHGICVTNIPTYGTAAVAQYAIALLLELCHHIGEHNRSVQQGDWSSCKDFCYWNYPLIELKGKTMGIIGFGRIGRETARLASALGMRVLAFDRYQNEGSDQAALVDLDTLLKESDVISLHCPLLPETEGIINQSSIEKMKQGVMLINTSRGPLVAEQDLADALKSGKVSAAAVDVLSVEPVSPDNPLLGISNCIITPHIAWAPKESRQRLMNIAADNLKAFLAGIPQNVVC